ncbi:MAG: LemA family protein [Proteobacteria bacterium]|nr:LemA family protein [Pseudomonadota bacterium]
MRQLLLIATLVLSVTFLSGCGIQALPKAQNTVDAALAEVTNQYKRRSDLIPNLVNTVKGFAKQEQTVLTEVTNARARATSITLDPKNLKAQDLENFQKAQGELGRSLGRLLVVAENYPQLKSDANFRDLQAQLEGTENRITVARNRYIDAIKEFNNLVTVPPYSWTNSLFYHFEKKPQFALEGAEATEAQKAPEVKF